MLYISVTVNRCYRLSCRAGRCTNDTAPSYHLHMHRESYTLPANAGGVVFNVARS